MVVINQAQERQEYRAKPLLRICANCEHFGSELLEARRGYLEEKGLRCTLGNFAVQKFGTCREHGFQTKMHTFSERKPIPQSA